MNKRVKQHQSRIKTILQHAQLDCGLTRKQLAQLTGMSLREYERRLYGEVDFRISELMALADVLGLGDSTRAALMGAKEQCIYEVFV